jgi:DNA-binding MarR family transcriptional regulator
MTPLEGIVGYQLRVAQLAVFSDFLKSFADMELRPVDYSILRLIQANPGVRQGQLAEALGIKRANMVGLLHGLEARKLIERCATEDDRRANALHLTKSGRAFVTKVQQVWTRHEQRIIDLIGGTEKRDQLIELLRKIPPLVSARVTRVKRK